MPSKVALALHSPFLISRFCSGVTLLSTSAAGSDRIKKCRRRATATRTFSETYLALVNGLPRKRPLVEEAVDVLSKRCDVIDNPAISEKHIEPVVTRYPRSKRFLSDAREDAKRYFVAAEMMATATKGPAALMKLQSSSTRFARIEITFNDNIV